jgi:NitT/TauT family transport system substrate-binding protein
MRARIASRRVAAGLIAALLTAGSALAADTAIQFSLDFRIEGPAAPFLVPIDRGYYKTEGLNVTVDPAANSLEPITRVANGTHEMGVTDINTLIRFRDANPSMPVKAVFIVYDKPPFAVIGRKSRGVLTPKDLEGKRLGASAPDGAFAQWPAFAKVSGIDASKVTIENVGYPLRVPMLAAGQVDAITGYSFASFINLKDRGVPVDDLIVLMMADYGLKLYGDAIIVNPKFAADHPDAVRGFLRAFLRGLKDTIRAPASAVDSVVRRNELARKPIELERLQMAIRDNVMTAEVKANGLGSIDNARFAAAIDQIALAYKFKGDKPKPEQIFDAAYLPPIADRKLK